MNKIIAFARPYFRIKDEGACSPLAIVLLSTRDREFRTEDMGNGMASTVPCKRQYYLRVNLWLVQFEFEWERNLDKKNYTKKIKQFWWYIRLRCRFCGGKVWVWDIGKHYCHKCGEKQ